MYTVPSGPVTNVVVNVLSSDTIELEWDLPEAEDHNGIIISYIVEINAIDTGERFQLTSISSALTVNNVNPFTTYSCRIAARTIAGTGPYSIAVIVTTLQEGKQ